MTTPPSAMVRVPMPPDVHTRIVAPSRARAGHRHDAIRTYPIADVSGGEKGGDIYDLRAVRDREFAVPKPPMLSPPLVSLIQLDPGPITVTVPFERADNPTEPLLLGHRTAVLD